MTTYISLRPQRVGDETRARGDLIPEAADWPNLTHWVNAGYVEAVDDDKASQRQAELKAADQRAAKAKAAALAAQEKAEREHAARIAKATKAADTETSTGKE